MFVRPRDDRRSVPPRQRAMRAISLSFLGGALGLSQWLMWFSPAVHPLATEQWVGRALLGVIALGWLAALMAMALGRTRWLRQVCVTAAVSPFYDKPYEHMNKRGNV